MANDYMGADDYTGYDDDGLGDDDEVLGAVARRTAMVRAMRGGQGGARRAAPPPVRANAPRMALERTYMGLNRLTFTNLTATSQNTIVEPQRMFRAERLVISRRSLDDPANLGIQAVVRVSIADKNQSPTLEVDAPTEMFAPDATQSHIDFSPCKEGQKVQITISLSAAPLAGDDLFFTCGFYGAIIRAE